jgi:hypothetical protein
MIELICGIAIAHVISQKGGYHNLKKLAEKLVSYLADTLPRRMLREHRE